MLVPVTALFTGCTSLIKSVDHRQGHWEQAHSNAFLWRRVKGDPAVFNPKKLSPGYAITPKTEDWVIDSQDRTAFFVPNQQCDGLSPRMWRAEAIKAVNRIVKESRQRNTVTVTIGWPAYATLVGVSGMGMGH